MSKTSSCATCHHNLASYDYCPECGRHLSNTSHHPDQCAHRVSQKQGFKFCIRCGHDMQKNSELWTDLPLVI